MVTSSAVRLIQPSKRYVFLSKFLGGTMWFWILWRLKHDWHELVVSTPPSPKGKPLNWFMYYEVIEA